MQIPFVDLKAQYLSIKNDVDYAINSILQDATFIGGKPVKDFENTFASLTRARNVIGVGNGTDAIYIVMKMLGIGVGDEVITASTSWISTSETISQTGAKPVFVDVDKDSYTINPRLIEEKITTRTRAIIPVHLYGQMAHIKEIKQICIKHGLFLIEDCAQSHFSEEDGILAGMTGDAGTFSFYPGKNLGAYGDAGCILTNNDELAKVCRMFANHGALKKHEHEMEGINSRLDTIQASILNVKTKYILSWTEARIANAKRYHERLRAIDGITLPHTRPGTKHTFHLYVIRTPNRDRLKTHLESLGIQTAVHYPTALPNLRAYQYMNHKPSDFPISTRLQDEILSLPMYPELTESQVDYISSGIQSFFYS